MGNRADDYGTDVEIYTKALTTTIYPATPTGAPERLLDLLDRLGLKRHEVHTAGPVYTWHTVPEHFDHADQKCLVSRAIPSLLMAGYKVNINPDLFDEAAYRQAVHEIRSGQTHSSARNSTAPAAPARPSAPRRAL
ncbi:hypothetical protein [Streptomyces collinus]|uniref:hypothetical protein n=1 Tax=Streptomyces collinus TaxID=42684 RepID=UPI0037D55574